MFYSKDFVERSPLKWFKDDLDIIQSRKMEEEISKEVEIKEKPQNESIIIEELQEKLIVEEKFKEDSTVEGNMKKELIKGDLIVKENTNEQLIIEKNLKEESIIENKLKEELNIEENLEKVSTVKKHLKTELIDQTNLGENTFNENIGEEADVRVKKTTNLSKNINLEECSSYSEDSESDDEITSSKSSTNSLVKEMDQKSLQKFYKKTKEQTPGRDLIDRILKGRYPKINQIFDEPTKAIPLPRRSGTINVTFSERAFPTPARESSFIEEQEVRVSSIVNSMINIFLLRVL